MPLLKKEPHIYRDLYVIFAFQIWKARRAPYMQGFIATATRRKAAKNNGYIVEATKYINLSSIAGFVIDNEALQRVGPSYFTPEPEIKVKR